MWCDSDFDFLLDLALEVNKPRYRLNLYHQAQNILNQEFPVIPLAHGIQFTAYSKSLTAFALVHLMSNRLILSRGWPSNVRLYGP